MPAVIDLSSELLVDCSRVRSAELRMLLVAIGHPIVKGSAWMVVSKEVAAGYPLPLAMFAGGGCRAGAHGSEWN